MSRGLLLALGLAAAAAALAPWGGHAHAHDGGHGFAGHMLRHMALVAVAAPLIALGVSGGPVDPATRAPALLPAIPASLVELFVVWGWHAPGPHALARESGLAFAAEQASFLLSGLWLWIACFGGRERTSRQAGEGALAMLLTSIHMTLLGVLLAASGRPLFAGAHGGQGALDDQQLGGIVMLAVGGAVYLAGGVTLAARLLGGDGATSFTSPRRGEVDVAPATAGEGAQDFPESARPPHPALRADLSPLGKGDGSRFPPGVRSVVR